MVSEAPSTGEEGGRARSTSEWKGKEGGFWAPIPLSSSFSCFHLCSGCEGGEGGAGCCSRVRGRLGSKGGKEAAQYKTEEGRGAVRVARWAVPPPKI